MGRWLYRSLLTDRSRTLLSMAAIGAVIVLIVVLEGFTTGLWRQVRAYKEHLPIDLVAVPAGSGGSVQGRSVIPAAVVGLIQDTPGVQRVYPLVNTPAVYSSNGLKTAITVVGYQGPGGPWRLASGRGVVERGDMVMDRALAKKYGLSTGGTVSFYGRDFRIVGISDGTSSLFGSYVFISLEEALEVLTGAEAGAKGIDATPNMLLIELDPGLAPAQARQRIVAAAPAVNVMAPDEMAAKDVAAMKDVMGPVMNLMVIIAYVMGILVIGLTLYAAILERIREYGIAKALGSRNAQLYRFVVMQALVFSAGGLLLGLLAAQAVAALISWRLPEYLVVVWEPGVLMRTTAGALVMGLISSMLPVRQVAGVEPGLVFK